MSILRTSLTSPLQARSKHWERANTQTTGQECTLHPKHLGKHSRVLSYVANLGHSNHLQTQRPCDWQQTCSVQHCKELKGFPEVHLMGPLTRHVCDVCSESRSKTHQVAQVRKLRAWTVQAERVTGSRSCSRRKNSRREPCRNASALRSQTSHA